MSKIARKGIDDLVTTHPALVEEWDYEKNKGLKTKGGRDISTPDKVMAGSNQKVHWICKTCGHKWQAVVNKRTDGCRCPACAGQVILNGEKLDITHPILAKEWHPTKNVGLVNKKGKDISTPGAVTAGSSLNIWWKCKVCGHEWQAKIADRARAGHGCPACAGKVIRPDKALSITHPRLSEDWDYERNKGLLDKLGRDISTPDKVSAGSNLNVWWKCKVCGRSWPARIYHRTTGFCICPACSKSKLIQELTDLQTVRPDIASQWHPTKNQGLTPRDVKFGSKKQVWWLCSECAYEWEATINNRTSANSGCPRCAGRVPFEHKTDLKTLFPHIAEDWDYEGNADLKDGNGRDISTPDNITAHSKQKVSWKCKVCNQRWKAAVGDRTRGDGCPYCAGILPIENKTDLKFLFPDIADEWHPTKNIGLTDGNGRDISSPNKVTAGSSQKVWWKCKICNQEWQATISSRTSGCGCPQCNESKGEKTIRKVLNDHNLYFKTQNIFSDRRGLNGKGWLRDDFALFNADGQIVATIEFNGRQHYEPVAFNGHGDSWAKRELELTQARDSAKTKYLQKHNIPQLIIPYWEFDNIEQIINNFIRRLSDTHTLLYRKTLNNISA